MLLINPIKYPKVTDGVLISTLITAQEALGVDEKAYSYYDGPLSGSYKDPDTGQIYFISVLSPFARSEEQWYLTPVSKTFLEEMKAGEVTIADGIKGENGFMYLLTHYWRTPGGIPETVISKMPSAALTEDLLPVEGTTIFGDYWEDRLTVDLPDVEERTERELEVIRKTLATDFKSKRAKKIIAHELLRRADRLSQNPLSPGNDTLVREAVRKGISFLEPENFSKTNRFLCFYENSRGAAFEALFEKTLWHPELPNEIISIAVSAAKKLIVPHNHISTGNNHVQIAINALGILGVLQHPDFDTHIQTIISHETKWFRREVYRRLEDTMYYEFGTPNPAERGFPIRKYRRTLSSIQKKLRDSISSTFGKPLSC